MCLTKRIARKGFYLPVHFMAQPVRVPFGFTTFKEFIFYLPQCRCRPSLAIMEMPDTLATLYHPAAAIVVFMPEEKDNKLYLEYYDMDENGCPVNPRPLSVQEAQGLSEALDTQKDAAKAFLKPKGLLPSGVLHINPAEKGSVIWYTRPQTRKLHFTNSLGIASQELPLPALVSAADKKRLSVYALKGRGKPRLNTPLYSAPFLNCTITGTSAWVRLMYVSASRPLWKSS